MYRSVNRRMNENRTLARVYKIYIYISVFRIAWIANILLASFHYLFFHDVSVIVTAHHLISYELFQF